MRKSKPNRAVLAAAAAERKALRAAKHAAMMAKHAERRSAIALWEAAYDLWTAADCQGPEPIHPDVAKARAEERAMMAETAEWHRQQQESDDLYRAAAEMGIDLAA